MRRLIPLTLAALAAAGGLSTAVADTATAAPTTASSAAAHTVNAELPPHVFAPYFETYDTTDGGLAQLAHESGNKYVTLAFLQTDTPGSCTAYWNGDTSDPISATAAGSFGQDIAAIQAAGGDVIPSFGGYGADTTNTELADSCTSAGAIAKVYEQLAATYHITRIDLDVEANSTSDTAGIQRRNEAIAEAEAWATAHRRELQFDYTVPTFTTGLTASALSVLQSAVAEHAKITEVNIMTFDYYTGNQEDMLAAAEAAATAVEGQLKTLYPHEPERQLWRMIGITQMPGIDDYGPAETFTTAQAPAFLSWAARKGLGLLSIWALQRDNGGCPGTKGAGNCSGVNQPTWYFSHTFKPFNSLP